MNKVPNPPLPLHLRNAQTKRKFMQNTQPGRYQFIKYIPTFIRLLRGDGGGSDDDEEAAPKNRGSAKWPFHFYEHLSGHPMWAASVHSCKLVLSSRIAFAQKKRKVNNRIARSASAEFIFGFKLNTYNTHSNKPQSQTCEKYANFIVNWRSLPSSVWCADATRNTVLLRKLSHSSRGGNLVRHALTGAPKMGSAVATVMSGVAIVLCRACTRTWLLATTEWRPAQNACVCFIFRGNHCANCQVHTM